MLEASVSASNTSTGGVRTPRDPGGDTIISQKAQALKGENLHPGLCSTPIMPSVIASANPSVTRLAEAVDHDLFPLKAFLHTLLAIWRTHCLAVCARA